MSPLSSRPAADPDSYRDRWTAVSARVSREDRDRIRALEAFTGRPVSDLLQTIPLAELIRLGTRVVDLECDPRAVADLAARVRALDGSGEGAGV